MEAGGRAELAPPQVTPADLDIGIVGQLPAAHLPLGDQFEPGPMHIVGFQAALGCRGLVEEALEYASRNPNDTFMLAHADAETRRRTVRGSSAHPWENGRTLRPPGT
jgi:hypothetical protein